MQTDAKELRAAAKQIKVWSRGDPLKLADYILATVREDDGEEQPHLSMAVCFNATIIVDSIGVYVRDGHGRSSMIRNGRPTRGQFRELCRGLGIDPPTG